MESLFDRPTISMTNPIDKTYPGRLALQQRVLPSYRAPLLEILAEACGDGLVVFAGKPLKVESITTTNQLTKAQLTLAKNRHMFHPRHPLFFCWQQGLVDWLEKSRPDALIVEANPRYRSTPNAIQWMHTRGKPVIGWGLGPPPIQGPMSEYRRKIRWDFLKSLDAVISYSQRGARQYQAEGIPEHRVFVAHNAAVSKPEQLPPDRAPYFDGIPTLLFVGRLQPRKRVDLLLRACAALPFEQRPRLIIVGDGPARRELQSLGDRLYPKAVFKGAKHGPELKHIFQTSDLFVLPGTGGLAIQQAMSHGLPVIVARGDGTQEDLVRPENGWLIPSDNLEKLTASIQQALSDPELLRKKGRESFRIVNEEIHIEAMVQTFIQALNAVHEEH